MAIRIGINALFLIPSGVGGTEIYLRGLLSAMANADSINEYRIFVNRETGDDLTPDSPRFRVVRCGVRATFRPARILYEQAVLPWLLADEGIDVVLNPGYTAPFFARCPAVTVFHDLQHKRLPEMFRRHELPFWNLLLWLAALRSRRLIAVSEPTARDLTAFLPCSAGKTSVVPHGVDLEFFRISERRGRAECREPLLLSVSTLHWHKNFERLLEAFSLFRADRPEYRLVVVGLRGFAAGRIDKRVRELGLSEFVTLTGWISRAQVHSLFEKADAFIAPSLFEGFGFPVLEAMAAGIPTACSSIPVFDWLTDGAAIRFDPTDVAAIARAMIRAVTDSAFRSAATECGPARARLFDWKRTAELTIQELIAASEITAAAR